MAQPTHIVPWMRALFTGSLVLCLTASAGAQEIQRISDQKLHQPGPMPDRIVLTWRKDPARSQAVTWRTDISVGQGQAEYALATAGPEFASKSRAVEAVTTPLKTDLGEAHYHTVNFNDLQPRTKYVYRVGDGIHWSEWNHFQTASDKAEPFSFVYFGDAQHDIRSHWSRVVREAYAAAPQARFSIHAGDLINIAGRDAEWGEWFQASGWINRTVPVLPAPGNHEIALGLEGKSILAPHWKAQFALPDHGPAGLESSVYYLDYQGTRIVSLNSNEKKVEQAAWLERVLSDNPNRWTILTFHHPILSTAEGRDNPALRKLWQPIFDKHRVDLVLQGHDHSYGRTGLEGFEGSTGGTVYVVSVSGPGMYTIDPDTRMRRTGQGKQLFQVIRIDGDRLTFESRTATGELYDSFELKKQANGQPNVLTDGPSAPAARQRRTGEPWNWMPIAAIVVLVGVLIAMRILRRARARNADRPQA